MAREYQSSYLDQSLDRYCALDSVEVAAEASALWQALADFENWPSWNPLYVRAAGMLALHQEIQFAVALPGMKAQRGQARVTRVKPAAYIQYEIKSLGGLARAVRFMEIQPLESGRCRFANGEIMTGLPAPLLFRAFGEKVRQGLAAMNEALKQRLEA